MNVVKEGVSISRAALSAIFFVRQTLNYERVVEFGLMLDDGTKLPDIEVLSPTTKLIIPGLEQGKFIIVDGRHRNEAHDLVNNPTLKEFITARYVDFDSIEEMIGYAYQANNGGSLPSSKADTEHVIYQYMARNVSAAKIAEFTGLSQKFVARYMEDIRSKENRRKLQAAMLAIETDGISIPEAAKRCDIDPAKIRSAISFQRKKTTRDIFQDLNANLTQRYRSTGTKDGNLRKKAIGLFEEGDLTAEQMMELFRHLRDAQRKALRNTEADISRLEALAKGGGLVSAKNPAKKSA